MKLTAEMTKGLKKVEITALEAAVKELPAIVTATVAGGFLHTSPAVHGPLVKAGLVEIAPADAFDGAVTPEGNVATKATEAGAAFANTGESAAAGAATTPAKVVITLDTAIIPIPEKATGNRGGGVGRESIYPFKTMDVMQSFFVPATEKMPEPWNSLASAVANAEKHFATPVLNADGSTKMKQVRSREKGKEGQLVDRPELKKVRTFTIREVTENGVKGARVWRTA